MFDVDNLQQLGTQLNTMTSFEFVFWVSRSLKVIRLLLSSWYRGVALWGRCILRNADCGMRNSASMKMRGTSLFSV